MAKDAKLKSILVTGGAGFIGSNLVLELQARFPEAWITVVDDFRSGSFKNLRDFKGDVVAEDISRLDWAAFFGKPRWDAVFHLASITDTTEHDQRLQVHDNVEGFRRLLHFVSPKLTPVIYASSAATYGIGSGINREDDPPAPANVYAFSKMILDNLARRHAVLEPEWKIVGLRYFNVYGPREAHKGIPASMIYHLAQQMRAGKPPRLFKFGEQKRDFVYVKDVVACTLAALNAPSSGIYNVGSGAPRTFNDAVTALNGVLGSAFEPEYFDNPYPFYQPHTEADMSRTRTDLGFEPKFTLEDGVRDYFESGFLLGN
ncbi:MAG: ADP-glyceromanno-heptose 6-epimerase [Candidatus Methylacidiphilales bacterium]